MSLDQVSEVVLRVVEPEAAREAHHEGAEVAHEEGRGEGEADFAGAVVDVIEV